MVELKPGATSQYAKWLTWTVRAGLLFLALAFLADLAGLGRNMPLERMPEIWSAPATVNGPSSVALIAIAWLATCSIACLVPLLPMLRRDREIPMAVICIVQVAVLVFAALGGWLAR